MRFTKGNPRTRPTLHYAKLPLFLREHIPMGDDGYAVVERYHGDNERENCARHTERHFVMRPER